MKPKIYIKFLLSYVFFGIAAILVLCTFTQRSITNYLEKHEAQNLYREATQIASKYAANFTNTTLSLEDFQVRMESLSSYLSAEIWVVDSQGNVLFNSSDSSIGQRAANAHYTTLPDFDPTSFGNTYYTVGNFYDSFSENTITVFSPVTANYRVRSYVLIHKPVATIDLLAL